MRRTISLLLLTAAPLVHGGAVQGADKPVPERPRYEAQTAPTAPQPNTSIVTLGEALSRAYRTNPELLARRAQLRAADFQLPQARAGYGPKLSATASYGYERDEFDLLAGNNIARADWTATAEAVITQPLFSFGRNAAAERSASANIAFNRFALRATEGRVLLDTITAYSVLARDIAGLAIARDNLALLDREHADTQTRLKARETTATDFEQVQTRLELGRVQVHRAQQQLATSRAQFLRTVGALPGDLTPPDPLDLPVTTLEQAYLLAGRNNPVLGAAYEREKVSRAAVESARADMMPRVDLRGRAATGPINPYNSSLKENVLRGEVVLSTPIFESGLLRARLDEAKEANDSDWRLIDASLRDNRADVATAWNTMVSQRASIGQLRAAVDAAQRAYEGALLQEREGMRTTLDVLDLLRELLAARINLNDAVSDAYVGEAQLLFAMGKLEANNLLPDEPLYDPEPHYADARDNGDIPLITPIIRTLDGGRLSSPPDRPIRDPAGPLTAEGASVELNSQASARSPVAPQR